MSDNSTDNGSRSLMGRLVQAMGGEPRDREEVLELLRDAQTRNLFDQNTLQMIEGVFHVVDERVRDIMIPRAQMVVVERDAALEEILPVIIESGHSRFPVIGDDKDDVVGVLLAKDLLRFTAASQAGSFLLEDVIRTAVFTPESKRLNVLLQEFRSNRNHMAIVFDEYGGVAGLVTIEDVLEQIVGKIDDEHDISEDLNVRKRAAGTYTVRALTPIEEFNKILETNFSDDEFDTIGGVVMAEIGHMPKPGESITLEGITFKILAADSRRMHLMQVISKAAEQD